MSKFKLTTPVVFLIFNNPSTTRQVFEEIRKAKPEKLLVIADGPRADKPGEEEKCSGTRRIIQEVDWDCEVLTNYSEVNLGCGRRIASGLDWAFENVEEAIILEDDCLPKPSFFRFCQELLEHYRYDERIMMISGTNLLGEWKSEIQSYHFSYYGDIWGWASWKRAWKHYDYNVKLWASDEVKARIRDILCDDAQYLKREEICGKIFDGIDVTMWAYQWTFARLTQSGLSVVPAKNMISNIGFHSEATHTQSADSPLANSPVFDLEFPLIINPIVVVDREFDREYFELNSVPKKKKDIHNRPLVFMKKCLRRFFGILKGVKG